MGVLAHRSAVREPRIYGLFVLLVMREYVCFSSITAYKSVPGHPVSEVAKPTLCSERKAIRILKALGEDRRVII